jgi:hypothetical protein
MFIEKLFIDKYNEKIWLFTFLIFGPIPVIINFLLLVSGLFTFGLPLYTFLTILGLYLVVMTEIIFLKDKSNPGK